MIIPTCTNISDIFDGNDKAYIYFWISKKLNCIYIGETNDRRGTFGRASGHISQKGTLRQRVKERLGERLESGNDFILLSFMLPREKRYTGIESRYRESVEYLVHVKLIELRGNKISNFKLISRVRSSHRINEKSVKEIAESIIGGFLHAYKKII